MLDQNQFQEKLRNLFLELAFNISNYTYEEMCATLEGGLPAIVDAKYIGIYTLGRK